MPSPGLASIADLDVLQYVFTRFTVPNPETGLQRVWGSDHAMQLTLQMIDSNMFI